MAVAELFRALGDSNRLEMVKRLSSGKRYTINTLFQGMDITRQGARKHLQILVDSDLVKLQSQGRDTQVLLNKKKLEDGRTFIAELEQEWDSRLEALRGVIESE